MPPAPLPTNEFNRITDLYNYRILDTDPENSFDALTSLVAKICEVPVCLISLIDTDRQWFKSCFGLNAKQTPRDQAFCAYTILGKEPFIVTNAITDSRVNDNPLVINEPKIRFYVGVPLISPKNFQLGSLCIIDFVPRETSPFQLQVLQTIADQVISLLEARLYKEEITEYMQSLEAANREIAALNSCLHAENARMSYELHIAGKLQKMVLPCREETSRIDRLDVATYMQPATEVGGDYYDILQTSEGIRIGIGDVTGHGLESGVVMIMIQAIVTALSKIKSLGAEEVLAIVNDVMYSNLQRMKTDKSLTLSIVDLQHRKLKVAGQHEEVIVLRSNGEIERIDTLDLGFPIGLLEDIGSYLCHTEILLREGDVVILFTDGILEAENSHKELYGLERFLEVVQQHRQQKSEEICAAIVADVNNFIGDTPLFDDITLVVVVQN